MVCEGCTILHEVLCLAVGGEDAPLLKCQKILALLERSLPLAGAFFWFPEPFTHHGKNFLEAYASHDFPPCQKPSPDTASPLPEACASSAESAILHFPAGDVGNDLGVLTCILSGGLAEDSSLPQLAQSSSRVLAGLVREHIGADRQQRQVHELVLLDNLAQGLRCSFALPVLLDEVWSVLEEAGGIACAILRPMHGETVLGKSLVRIVSHRQADLGTFEKLEAELSCRILQDEQMQFVAASGVCLPLMFQGRMRGTLFLVEDGRAGAMGLGLSDASRVFLERLGAQVAQNLERIKALEDRALLLQDNSRKLHEISLLYRISRAMHSTLHLDDLMHLILSAVTIPWGGGFERAMLFLANERSGVLQGMVGVTRRSARYLFPREESEVEWELPLITEGIRERQRQDDFCQLVLKQRLPLSPDDNPLARALAQDELVVETDTMAFPGAFGRLAEAVKLNACALVPLQGRSRALGVLVVDSACMSRAALMERRRFLELFANQAAQAMENSMLLHRVETSHRDLRETQERLIQGEKMAALGETAASVTHELRNPLVSIGGFARRLARSLPEGTREQEYSGIIVREVRRMEEMLTNILGFSKKQMLCIADCDLIKVIEEVLVLEEDALREGAVRLVRELSDDLAAIQGDEQKLRQVIVNLVDNARQAMRDGGILIVRAYRTSLRGDRAVAVEIEDTGGGIPANILRNIFNPFFTTRKQGTGLGLPIVHRIVEHHQGEIEVQNTERGARFVLRLPEAPPACLVMDKHRPFR
ncbi:sensor histidine kinase, GAF domain-containing [Syntrophotalea carbinolica DSM 2380]|uniref:histidine kinase n=1 Tax=Syntrophotalea carbinolica (strain DSM 2380 / NBRC 103641 / GraBd1) TaxID=338963 RepID=Q3A0W3_SYNC1|nr:ATP-binding protein [Syntrophotalea carbinolica]ABA89994.1 sensor histidine kinase, GAF domain-containing [Syntrophotalea carbinolica DSM 2380]